METIFIKRFIKTEDDLPKEKGVYEALYSDQKTFGKTLYDSSPSCNIWWTNNVYWYQKPTTLAELIKEKLPSDKVDEWADFCAENSVSNHSERVLIKAALSLGVTYAINKLTE